MNFIHSRKQLENGDVIELKCESACNFMLADDHNFSLYKKCKIFEYFGGHFTEFPARITAPHAGDWNIIIDAPGVEPIGAYSINIIS